MIRADIAAERATRSRASFYKLQHIINNIVNNNVATTTNSSNSGVNRYSSSVH